MAAYSQEGEEMIRAVFFDIDGTLQSMITHEIPERTLQALYALKEKGVLLFPCTGRPPVQLQMLSQNFQNFPWDGYVMLNGQYCMDGEKKMFYDHPIRRETFDTLIPYLETVNHPVTFMELDYQYDLMFNENAWEYVKKIGREDLMTPVDDIHRVFTHPTYQISPLILPEKDEEFLKHAPYMKSVRWTDAFADMIPCDGGKPEGMKQIMEHFHIAREETMAFGDGGNDISMLEYAGIGIAMGNGRDEVKAAADYVTDTCENSGVYYALEHFGVL